MCWRIKSKGDYGSIASLLVFASYLLRAERVYTAWVISAIVVWCLFPDTVDLSEVIDIKVMSSNDFPMTLIISIITQEVGVDNIDSGYGSSTSLNLHNNRRMVKLCATILRDCENNISFPYIGKIVCGLTPHRIVVREHLWIRA